MFSKIFFQGHLDIIPYQLSDDFEKWSAKYNKPVIVTEYGADSIAGLHCVFIA